MVINFPDSPFIGQLYTFSNVVWEWSGEYWGLWSGQTGFDVYTTGLTYNNENTFTITDNSGNTYNATINQVTGLTVNGILTINPATGQTYSVINFSGDPIMHNYGTGNFYVGKSAGSFSGTGTDNTGFGGFVLDALDNGDDNTGVGSLALTDLTGGTYNTAFGAGSLQNLVYGDNNTAVGVGSNALLQTGSGNTSIGFQTLFNNTDGSDNVAIGNKSGFNGTGSNKLYIANNETTTLIYGEFDNQKVGINTTSPTNTLHVSGSTDPVRFEGLESGNTDTRILTSDSNGVVRYRNFSDFSGGTGVSGDYLPLSGGTVTGDTIFQSGLTATTISGGTFFGNGSGLTNVQNIYNIDGSLTSNRIVDLNSNSLNFSSSTNPNTLVLSGGNVGIGTITATAKLHVNNTGTSATFLAEDSTNPDSTPFVIDASGNTGIGILNPSYKLDISGTTRITGSGTTQPLLHVIGSQGELFTVTDSLTGSLFSVNDISGLPTLEVFSDDTILMGSYYAPSLNTTKKLTLTAGTNTIYSIPTSAYTGGFFEYTLLGSSGARSGSIMSIWSGTTAQFTEVTTSDIGSTTGVTFSVGVSGDNAVLSSSATTSGWTLKTIIRSI